MELGNWIGKLVYIKLIDGTQFTFSKVLAYEEPFLSITDKFGYPAIINSKEILRIKEERWGKEKEEEHG